MKFIFKLALSLYLLTLLPGVFAAGGAVAVKRVYPVYPDAPVSQSLEQAQEKSAACMSCHTQTDSINMHSNDAIVLGCIDCHGGQADVFKPAGVEVYAPGHGKKYNKHNDASHTGMDKHAKADNHDEHLAEKNKHDDGHGDGHYAPKYTAEYQAVMDKAHVLPVYPDLWHYPSSANPERSYTLLNKESAEFIRFNNPSDYRIVDAACGACHKEEIEASKRSLHSTGAMLWGGASYNNGILPFKNYILGEAYDKDGTPILLKNPVPVTPELAEAGVIESLAPLPAWETVKPGDIFRVFERGGRNILSLFPETGIPNSLGQIQRLEEPGRPDIRQSNRGPGTGGRISVPLINITKTRLNDPFTWFQGTNDQPGDYRNSGCASCHVVYANDRDPRHSGPYAKVGHTGQSITIDPTIDKTESGHPIEHKFSNAIPNSQCMICHMHQPNMFINTYLGYTMWDYESDAPFMWPEEQQYPSHEETLKTLNRNPEGAAVRGKWADVEFLKGVSELNPELNDTQFADYHGHGWNFRAVFKRDRKGNLLDAEGEKVEDTDPDKFKKAVHMSSVHLDVGMHCVDCHFAQDNHGNGHIQGEVALAVEIDCADCHGTSTSYPSLKASGPAAIDGGTDLSFLRTPDGRQRFVWRDKKLYQRASLDPTLEWQLSLVKDAVDPEHTNYNAKAARAKLMSNDTDTLHWGSDVETDELAHSYDEMECYSCHTSWTTSCGGCHLPIESNWKTERHHYEGGETRNFATYNPQVARDQIFMLGRRGDRKGGKIAPTRSTSALVLSSTNANRERIYIQQPPIASSGYSSQAFNPHFPHTVRKTETKDCSDCHVSNDNDNNAIIAQTLMHGTNFINFVGQFAWLGLEGAVAGVEVTEWDEPQAVKGSYLHKYAYPDWYKDHQENDQRLTAYKHKAKTVSCLQMRGEYLYTANGKNGFQVFDIANISNKGYSQRIISAPFSPLGHNTRVDTKDASCIALATTQPVQPSRNKGELMREINKEQPMHPIYTYAFITDRKEGLIVSDMDTLHDGEPRNNFLKRAVTWNPDGILNGAEHITLAGFYAYIATPKGMVIVNLDNPVKPVLSAVVPMASANASAVQFRYLYVLNAEGLRIVDVTKPEAPILLDTVLPFDEAYRIYLARTYAYIAGGKSGLHIVDIEVADKPKLLQSFTGGELVDSRDVIVATTNASLFAYVADGIGGLKVIQLTSPELQPKFYGFSPVPKPQIIAKYPTKKPALSLSKGLDRDRGVDETGGQIAVFGRLGSRPFNLEEQRKMYQNKQGEVWTVDDQKMPVMPPPRAKEEEVE